MLEDESFRTSFFEKNYRLTEESYAFATKFLEKHNIPYYRGRWVLSPNRDRPS